MGSLKILKSGISSTIQDLGRYGYQAKGISVSGSMDTISHRFANILVGNDESSPCIEMTLKSDKILFNSDAIIAISGADMDFDINGYKIEINKTIFINAGDVLSSNFCKINAHAYLALKGGFEIEKVMGSYSTFLRAGIGGFKGRKLKDDDIINYSESEETITNTLSVNNELISEFLSARKIRFIFSNEKDRFTEKGIFDFLNSIYTIQNNSDRMGFKLIGKSIEHKDNADILSEGINFGSIQISGNGQPLIMMADRQTTGGYTKIGQVILADLPYLAQRKPQESLEFQSVEAVEAIEIWKESNRRIEEWKNKLNYNFTKVKASTRYITTLNNKSFNIKVSEI